MISKECVNNSVILRVNKLIKGISFAYSYKQQEHNIQTLISAFVTAGHV